jgi:hypothetical protein
MHLEYVWITKEVKLDWRRALMHVKRIQSGPIRQLKGLDWSCHRDDVGFTHGAGRHTYSYAAWLSNRFASSGYATKYARIRPALVFVQITNASVTWFGAP